MWSIGTVQVHGLDQGTMWSIGTVQVHGLDQGTCSAVPPTLQSHVQQRLSWGCPSC